MQYAPGLGHILIVDGDDNIAALLQVNLRCEGYAVDRLAHASEVDCSALGEVRLVIVDSMDDEYTGLDLVADIKSNPASEHVGIILCSSFSSERIVIDALDAGADDYIVKPFSLRQLVARVKSVLRRCRIIVAEKPVGNIITLRTLQVDLQTQNVKLDSRPVRLSGTEYSLLVLLLRNLNNYVSRVEIHRRIWSNDGAGDNERIVDTNISRLRKKARNIRKLHRKPLRTRIYDQLSKNTCTVRKYSVTLQP